MTASSTVDMNIDAEIYIDDIHIIDLYIYRSIIHVHYLVYLVYFYFVLLASSPMILIKILIKILLWLFTFHAKKVFLIRGRGD